MFRYTREEQMINDFTIVNVRHLNGHPLKVFLKNVYIPFGMNKNHSIKFDVNLSEDIHTNKGIAVIEKLDSECVNQLSKLLETKLERNYTSLIQKKKFKPNVCAFIQYSQGRLTTQIIKKTGIPVSETELKGFTGDVELVFHSFWIKDGTIYGKWKVVSILLKS